MRHSRYDDLRTYEQEQAIAKALADDAVLDEFGKALARHDKGLSGNVEGPILDYLREHWFDILMLLLKVLMFLGKDPKVSNTMADRPKHGRPTFSLGEYEAGKVAKGIPWALLMTLIGWIGTAALDGLSADVLPWLKESKEIWAPLVYTGAVMLVSVARQWLKNNAGKTS